MRLSPTAAHLEASASSAETATTGRALSRYRAPLRLADAERIASGLRTRLASVDDTDIFDLPEPIDDAPVRRIVTRAERSGEAASEFDYAQWSRELDDLLSRPVAEMSGAPSAGQRVARSHGAPRSNAPVAGAVASGAVEERPSSVTPVVTPVARAGGRGPSTWMPLLVLLASSAVMAGIIGVAAYGLSSVEMQAWMQGATQWLDALAHGTPRR